MSSETDNERKTENIFFYVKTHVSSFIIFKFSIHCFHKNHCIDSRVCCTCVDTLPREVEASSVLKFSSAKQDILQHLLVDKVDAML
jgi:hypothetical protein